MFSSRKIIELLKYIVILSFAIPLLFALIRTFLIVNINSAILALTFFISSLITFLYNEKEEKNKDKKEMREQIELIQRNQKIFNEESENYNESFGSNSIETETTLEKIDIRTVSTNGSPYNENIEGDFIAHDSITKNIKNIKIGNKEVEINPNNIIETFDEFRDILAQSIAQSSNLLEAISEFVKELTDELRKRPDIKACFDRDENISVEELVKNIFLELLNKGTTNDIHISNLINSLNPIQKINLSNSSGFIEHIESHGDNKFHFLYKGYTVHLFQEKLKRWRYRIITSDLSTKQSKVEKSRNIYFAMGRAVDQIDDEIDMNLQKSYEP